MQEQPPQLRNSRQPQQSSWLGLNEVTDEPAARKPNRTILHTVDGWGKTTIAASVPEAVFLQSRGETGLQTLIASGAIKHRVYRFPRDAQTWEEARLALSEIAIKAKRFNYLILDTLNGFYEMIVEHVAKTRFGNDMEKFNNYGQGMKIVYPEWQALLDSLDEIRTKHDMGIFCLCHSKLVKFANPGSNDYDRWVGAMVPEIWDKSKRWADVVLFGDFQTTIVTTSKDITKGRAKATGGVARIIHTVRGAGHDAKNRHGLDPLIYIGTKPDRAYSKLQDAYANAQTSNSEPSESEDEEPATE